MSTYITRMQTELQELQTKRTALNNFAHSNNAVFCSLPIVEQEDLWEQLGVMEQYLNILERRLLRASANV